ncbi:energy-coupling factor transporter ATPase [Geomicrobium sp. JCM 19039]|uniref:energy-coupling factor transporter ATPase n=1 Tax=Geomicrobium sp. JCM 19039 TaxID=1460636 RepID=UPI0005A7C85C
MQITFNNVSYTYMPGSPFEKKALEDVNLTIRSGNFTTIVGSTGSGKSTLMQHVNGLLLPTEGQVTVGNTSFHRKTKRKFVKPLRRKVGMVFQYPEHQLFGSTVEEDILFGPIQHGMDAGEVSKRIPELLDLVGLPQDVRDGSPFQLSGGQMRRVAIAGVLATRPEVLILDEPAAGLDPAGHRALLDLFQAWHKENGLTTVLVTHDMEDAFRYADEVVVMGDGRPVLQGEPEQVFQDSDRLQSLGLAVPAAVRIREKLNRCGLSIDESFLSAKQMATAIRNEGGK